MSSTSQPIFQLRKPLSALVVEPLKVVDQVASLLGLSYFLAGATARDLILENVFGGRPGRLTRDLDFAFALSNWKQFETLKAALTATKRFELERAAQRVSYVSSQGMKVNVDLIPFGPIQEGTEISWPPEHDSVLNVSGFSEALASVLRIQVELNLVVPVVSLPGLMILKLFAWADRRSERRDAPDILKILSEYGDAGNEDRLYGDDLSLTEGTGFDVTQAGARLLGRDVQRIAEEQTLVALRSIFAADALKGELLNQLVQSGRRSDQSFADQCRDLLDNFERGLAPSG